MTSIIDTIANIVGTLLILALLATLVACMVALVQMGGGLLVFFMWPLGLLLCRMLWEMYHHARNGF